MTCLLMQGAAATAASPTLYVGDAKEYSIAFKAEGPELYVMQFAGTTDCYYTEPHEDVGSGGFTAFPAPKLMRDGSEGLVAEESISISMWGAAHARVRAELSGDLVTGDFSYDESEESYHCDTGFSPDPFQASRYEPIGSAAAPASGEKRVYYGSEGPIEIFLRKVKGEVAGIRGAFALRCPLGKGGATPARHALFRRPAFAKLGEKDRFRRRVVHEGRTRSGARYKEAISLTGGVEEDAIAGTYLRVRSVRIGRKSAQRCVTGPISFRAARYSPAQP